MAKWLKTTFPGVRYREHETRKYGVKMDQYFTIRYKLNGHDKEEGLGWASAGWTAAKSYDRLKELKENLKSGQGPQTLKEKRAIEKERRAKEEQEEKRTAREAITFDQFFENYYSPHAEHEKKQRTVEREKGIFNLWVSPALGPLPLKEIIIFHLESLRNKMKKAGLSQRTIEYTFAIIRQIFNYAKATGKYKGEAPKIKIKKPDNGRTRFLTRKEAKGLLDALKVRSKDTHDMTLLSLHCGLRFGEIAALTWADVDYDRLILTIRDAKAGSRYAFLTKQAADMLKGRTRGKLSDLIFPAVDADGNKKPMIRISATFNKVVDDLGFNKHRDDPRDQIVFHSCRHTYASWLIESGQDLYTVQRMLGHKTNVMTMRYAHLTESRLRDAANSLSNALSIEPQQADIVPLLR